MASYVRWGDYGATGIDPADLELVYDPDSKYGFSPSVAATIQQVWDSVAGRNDRLFDGNLLNVVDVDENGRRLLLGPAQFRDYLVRRLILSRHGATADIEISDEVRTALRLQVRVLSSFVAVVADDGLLVGVRAGEDDTGALLSFPGSGYLDRDEDVTPSGTVRPTYELIEREVEEELGLADRIETIRCLGVFEDLVDSTHYNPALFSVVEVAATSEEVMQSIQKADDSWEFSEFFVVPIDEGTLIDLVQVGLPNDSVSAQANEFIPSAVEGTTSKTLLMLALLGRYWFGDDWFDSLREQHPEIEIRDVELSSGESVDDNLRTDGGEYLQAELDHWYDSGHEDDETLGWGLIEDPDGNNRLRLVFDIIQKKVDSHTQGRRAFLKTIGSVVASASVLPVTSAGTSESLQHFWPNALCGEESENALDLDTLDTLLFDNQLDWNQFKQQSQDIITDPDIVTSYDDVHLLSVFFRSIDVDFIRAIEASASRANQVFVYFADPVSHRTEETSALELHEDIELESFRHLFQDTQWGQFYDAATAHPANGRVPHPDSIILNRVRALANALRAIQMGVFLTTTMKNVHIRLVNHHEISLRGRLVGNHHASFVLNPKATIGTTPPRAGFITKKGVIIGELHEERRRITTKETYSAPDLVEMGEQVRTRIETLLDEALVRDEIELSTAAEIRTHADTLTLGAAADCNTSLDEWEARDRTNRKCVHQVRQLVNEAQPFDESARVSEQSPLPPGELFSKIEAGILEQGR
ncbi:hypothetical protein [Haloferax sp. DFSO60]|uniref:hypothetical protein n=1 Tax=Haloferax sp. DFSO60 TaxID=3388652 RepID=UPI0039784E7A